MGTQKNHLNGMIPLSTQNMFKLMGKKIITCSFFAKIFAYLNIQTVWIQIRTDILSDLDRNCLQMLSKDNKIFHKHGKS